ncbi:MAG: SufD family Fe-S cluster assembly protein, partial [Acidimicrobiales bacterium]
MARRRKALTAFNAADLPTGEEEEWRYSRIADIDLDRFAPADPNRDDALPDELKPVLDAIGDRAALAVINDGRLIHVEIDEARLSGSLTIEAAEESAGRGWSEPRDAFGRLHDAFVPEVVRVSVAKGAVVSGPIVLLQWTSSPGIASFGHVVIDVGEQAEASVVSYSGSAGGGALSVPVVEVDLSAASNLRFVSVQDLATDTWQLADLITRTGRDATLKAYLVALGGDYARTWLDVSLPAQGASAQIAAVYFGDGHQMHDFRSVQLHDGPRAASDFLLKGAVADEARGVYTGVIRVEKGA